MISTSLSAISTASTRCRRSTMRVRVPWARNSPINSQNRTRRSTTEALNPFESHRSSNTTRNVVSSVSLRTMRKRSANASSKVSTSYPAPTLVVATTHKSCASQVTVSSTAIPSSMCATRPVDRCSFLSLSGDKAPTRIFSSRRGMRPISSTNSKVRCLREASLKARDSLPSFQTMPLGVWT